MSGPNTNDGAPRASGETSVSDVVRSLDVRLDDVRREQAWRGIERSIDERPAAAPARTWRLPVFALATVAVIIGLLVVPRPSREEAKDGASNGPNGSANSAANTAHDDPPTTLSASAGQRTVFDRDGLTITLVGPSVATVQQEPNVVRVTVTKGLVVADRTPTAPALAVDAGDNHVVSRDARFAVRVEPTMVVLGAGAQARQIVEQHAIEMGALPLTERVMTTPPTSGTPTPAIATARAIAPSNAPASSKPPKPTVAAPEERRAPTLPDLRMDAAELYKRAEAALAIRDAAGAREFLERLLIEFPVDPRVDAARYDLALIARSFGQRERALELLDALIATGTDDNLTSAARRLRPTLLP